MKKFAAPALVVIGIVAVCAFVWIKSPFWAIVSLVGGVACIFNGFAVLRHR
jgi:hypothetical protein